MREHHHPPGTQQPRRRRQLDWELITCGISGHVLVGRDAGPARPEDALVVQDHRDVRWHRCLRCDTWISLPMPEQPVRPHPPERSEIVMPLRGRALHDRIVLRLIAIDRVFHFIVLAMLGVGVLAFAAHRASLRDAYYRILSALQGGVAGGPVQTSGHVGILHDLDRLFTLNSGTLDEVGLAILAYGVLEGVEAIGLWYGKRWAEYLTFIATTLLLPIEVYEIIHQGTVLKVIGFLINLAVVVWLLYRKRLFGLRGGGAVDEALRAKDMSWAEIDRTSLATPVPTPVAAAAAARGDGS
ncbi:MAG: DUF2127 domain-containing protein [Solirubrobacteraceae bacterium]